MAVTSSRSTQSPSMVKNSANAPVMFFDGAPVFGFLNGIVEVELTARVLMPKQDGTVGCDLAAIAHLRCGRDAAVSLRDALTSALNMMNAQDPADKPQSH